MEMISSLFSFNLDNQQVMIHYDEGTSFCDIKYKIVFLGDMSVGKSSIIERFINGYFDEKRQHTVGIDFLGKNVTYKSHLYRLQLWDTAGQEKFRSLIPAYLRDAHCAVIVYDISDPLSLANVESWISLFDNHKRDDAIMVLVGNKTDVKQLRKFSKQTGLILAKNNNIGYFEVSALSGDGIQALFESIIENIQVEKKQNKHQLPIGSEEKLPEEGNTNSARRINKEKVVKVSGLKKNTTRCCSI